MSWLVAYFRPHLGAGILALLCMGLVSGALGAQVLLIRWALDRILLEKNPTLVWLLPLGVVLTYGLQACGEVGRGYILRRVGQRVMLSIRLELFRRALRMPYATLHRQPVAALAARAIQDVSELQKLVTVFITLMQKPLSLSILLWISVRQEPELTLIAIGVLPLAIVPLRRLGRMLSHQSAEALETHARLQATLTETQLGILSLRALSLEAFYAERFEREARAQEHASLLVTWTNLLSSPAVMLAGASGAALFLWVGAERVLEGQSTPGSLVAFLVGLSLMYEPLKSLARVPLLVTQARAGADRLREWLSEPTDREVFPSNSEEPGSVLPLEVLDIHFSYGGVPVLKGASFQLHCGERIAICGASGAGKSTLLNLLIRIDSPDKGDVRVGSRGIHELDISHLRQHILLVPQHPFLLDDTLEANLRVGTAASEQEVWQAIRLTGLLPLVTSLPEGLQTRVGALGNRLSGGERQRMALARAVLRDPEILLLDEATSALDERSEAELFERLEPWLTRRACIFVAHRNSTVSRAGRRLLLREGRVWEGSGDS